MKIILVVAGLFLVGCSSSPKVKAEKPQYCHTSETIQTKNGDSVDSFTKVECTDDQVKRLVKPRLGMADNCGTFTYTMNIRGKNVQKQGISCMVFNERGQVVGWEVIDH